MNNPTQKNEINIPVTMVNARTLLDKSYSSMQDVINIMLKKIDELEKEITELKKGK